eukprot:1633757-Pyramimonas_sp.AAC.1
MVAPSRALSLGTPSWMAPGATLGWTGRGSPVEVKRWGVACTRTTPESGNAGWRSRRRESPGRQ